MARDNAKSCKFQPHQATWLRIEGASAVSGWDSAKQPFEWRDGQLPTIGREQLPVMTADDARNLLAAIEAVLAAAGEVWC